MTSAELSTALAALPPKQLAEVFMEATKNLDPFGGSSGARFVLGISQPLGHAVLLVAGRTKSGRMIHRSASPVSIAAMPRSAGRNRRSVPSAEARFTAPRHAVQLRARNIDPKPRRE